MITGDMHPIQMIKTVVEISLPPLADDNQDMINVSSLDGAEKICLPQEKIAKIFIQFISKAAIDEELKNILRTTYTNDVNGISLFMRYAKQNSCVNEFDEKRAAYTLLALIYGLSFFRVTDFMPPCEKDNREIVFDFVNLLLGSQ